MVDSYFCWIYPIPWKRRISWRMKRRLTNKNYRLCLQIVLVHQHDIVFKHQQECQIYFASLWRVKNWGKIFRLRWGSIHWIHIFENERRPLLTLDHTFSNPGAKNLTDFWVFWNLMSINCNVELTIPYDILWLHTSNGIYQVSWNNWLKIFCTNY